MNKTIFITGSSGFLATNMVEFLSKKHFVVGIDKIKQKKNLLLQRKNTQYYCVDINNRKIIFRLLKKYKPNYIVNFAAESHVDKSIDAPQIFIRNNINSLFSLLMTVKKYIKISNHNIKFIQISTYEVYGDVTERKKSKESDTLLPSSPYSSSKASADLIIGSFVKTYNFPAVILRLCNNYGFYQNPEKLIPRIILKIISNKNIPIYGNGTNKREWMFVEDSCKNIYKAMINCKIGNIYNIGSKIIRTNYQIATTILKIFKTKFDNRNIKSKIIFVSDRPGHDKRYALNSEKIIKVLNLNNTNLIKGLTKTVDWYIKNKKWIRSLDRKYEKRIGLSK
jgi:dTDP-glucose 4,6-dehydratase